ncbi:vacuolar protein sorting-associated protein 2 homolog 2-like [Phoenix dactylifera]|uniref:Vacuolar protein sorting-associated protein 2 homolog 2-like n=1 Tax=Phoenix dactylifera TaxID=42345 RepID=A0A8B9AMA7_PHODC|nr:vacuolar protein sorting-associated protein 2 homolog 2-like [Phoenix dactylifera]
MAQSLAAEVQRDGKALASKYINTPTFFPCYPETEMMSEATYEALDKDEAEEETEELTNQVLVEIGVDVASQLSSAPKGRIAANNKKVGNATRTDTSPANSEVDDLEKRLASLRHI